MANAYDIGDQVRITSTFQISGTDTDPTTVTFKFKKPGASSTTSWVYGVDAQVKKTAIGIYYVDLDLDTAGSWSYRWEGTGTVVAAQQDVLFTKESII